MIKKFIENIEDKAIKAILTAMDKRLDEHHNRIDEIDEKMEKLDKIKAIVEDGAETRKLIKKTAIGAIVTAIVGYIMLQIGIV